MDVVYTWVDGAWPGYAESLAHHAKSPIDLNPNRYRDNLDLLKYSLRSLERYAKDLGRVLVITARPQVPAWLDRARAHVVHHDEMIPSTLLPTFSSFGIIANLHLVPHVTRDFLYLEDDRLFFAPVARHDFVDDDGTLRLYAHGEKTPSGSVLARKIAVALSPWDRALAESNRALDARYGPFDRPTLKRAPIWITRDRFQRFAETFAPELKTTRENKFRLPGSIAPEHLYPYFLFHENQARFIERARVKERTGYIGLSNIAAFNGFRLRSLLARRPKMVALNDNFGARPNPRAVAAVRHFLQEMFPNPSRFERHHV